MGGALMSGHKRRVSLMTQWVFRIYGYGLLWVFGKKVLIKRMKKF